MMMNILTTRKDCQTSFLKQDDISQGPRKSGLYEFADVRTSSLMSAGTIHRGESMFVIVEKANGEFFEG